MEDSQSTTVSGQTVVELPVYPVAPGVQQTPLFNNMMNPQIDGSTEIRSNTIFAKALVVGQQTWIHNIVFTPTTYNQLNWGSGTIQFAGGTTTAIIAGNTGAMSATTYVYYNGTTTLQFTTNYATAIANNNILLAIAVPSASTANQCVVQVISAPGTTIDGSKIVTGKVQSADGKTYFDLDNKHIIVNDDTYDIILIGYQAGGF